MTPTALATDVRVYIARRFPANGNSGLCPSARLLKPETAGGLRIALLMRCRRWIFCGRCWNYLSGGDQQVATRSRWDDAAGEFTCVIPCCRSLQRQKRFYNSA